MASKSFKVRASPQKASGLEQNKLASGTEYKINMPRHQSYTLKKQKVLPAANSCSELGDETNPTEQPILSAVGLVPQHKDR